MPGTRHTEETERTCLNSSFGRRREKSGSRPHALACAQVCTPELERHQGTGEGYASRDCFPQVVQGHRESQEIRGSRFRGLGLGSHACPGALVLPQSLTLSLNFPLTPVRPGFPSRSSAAPPTFPLPIRALCFPVCQQPPVTPGGGEMARTKN